MDRIFGFNEHGTKIIEKHYQTGKNGNREKDFISFISEMSKRKIIDMKKFVTELKKACNESENEIIDDIISVIDDSANDIAKRIVRK